MKSRRAFIKTLFGTTLLMASRTKTVYPQVDDDDKYRPTPDGVVATQSRIYGPSGICFDKNDDLYIVDQLHRRIRRVDARTGLISTVAGTGERGLTGDGGPATGARLDYPSHVFVDREDNVFFTESIKDRVRRIERKSGDIATVAGSGIRPWEDGSREGDLATARSVDRPAGIATDSRGNLIISDSTRILKIDRATQRMTTLRQELLKTGGYPFPSELAIDRNDDIYFAESNTGRIRVLRSNKTIETIYTKRSDGTISYPVLDGSGALFFIESNLIFRLELGSRRVNRFAGRWPTRTQPLVTFGGDGGPAALAGMLNPSGLALDSQGNVYVADWLANRVRRIDRTTKIITTIAGNGEPKHPPRHRL